MIKVLHFIDSLRAGGKERQLVELLKSLSADGGYELSVVSMSHDNHYRDLSALDVPVHYLVRQSRRDFSIFSRFYSLCKSERPHIVHTWDSMTSVYALPAVCLLKLKLVNGMIRDAPPGLGLGDKRYLRAKLTYPFSDTVIANSLAGLDAYDAPRSRRVCVHNGFDFTRLSSLSPRRSFRSDHGILTEYVVGMVATFSPNKDYATFFRAAQEVLKSCRDVTFIAVGEGASRENCRTFIAPELLGHFRFLDKQGNIETIVNEFDVGILASSSTHGEGISNSITEYMVLEKPVIANINGGNAELVIDGETGFLVPVGDCKAMAGKLLHLLADPALRARMGRAGRLRVQQEFGVNKMVKSYKTVYARVLGAS